VSEIGQFRPVYSRDDIPHLQDLLHKATPQPSEAVLHRQVYELVSHANVVISEWDQLRDGNLDRRIRVLLWPCR
jgi:hypothetical protein